MEQSILGLVTALRQQGELAKSNNVSYGMAVLPFYLSCRPPIFFWLAVMCKCANKV